MLSCHLEAEHPLEINSKLVVSLRRQKIRSTGQILKIEINFQSEAKQQHESSNGIETYTGHIKLQSRRCFNANLILRCQISPGNKFNVGGQKTES